MVAPSVSLTGVTGNVTINLGTGTTGGATVSVADLDVGRNLSITGNAGDGNTIDVGTVASGHHPLPVLSTNAVTVGGNLSIRPAMATGLDHHRRNAHSHRRPSSPFRAT